MTHRTWVLMTCLFLVPLVASAADAPVFQKDSFGRLGDPEKIALLKRSAFDSPAARMAAAKYFTARWKDEGRSVLAAFCDAMGRAKAQEAIPVLVQHMDFRYFDDKMPTMRGRIRGILEGRVALDALVQIGRPALEPAVQHILACLPKTQDRFELLFFREALAHLASKSLGIPGAIAYVRELREKQKDASVLRELETVEAALTASEDAAAR